MVLECTAQGPDAAVYPYVVSQLCAALAIEKPLTKGNKKTLIQEAGDDTKTLLETGCDVVFIIWDRQPRWSKENPGDCNTDRASVLADLAKAGVLAERVVLCCIDQMMESWMVADGRGIDAWLATKTTRPIPAFGDRATQQEQTAPKNRIKDFLRDHYGKWKYNDFEDNLPIVKQMPDFNRAAKNNESFRHFKDNIEAICPQ